MEAANGLELRPTTAQRGLRLAMFACGASSAFSIEILGQLFWAELLLPPLAIVALATESSRPLFASRPFRLLMLGIILMLAGYMISDIASRTPPDLYLRGWARVIALGSSAFSLCVLCHSDPRRLWWFCIGMGIGGVAANALGGVTLWHWKLGYGEPVANLLVAGAGLLPAWVAALMLLALGGITLLLDYRSLGVLLAATAAASYLRHRGVGFDRLLKSIPLLLLAVAIVAGGSLYLLNVSGGENLARREASGISRFAALRIGTRAIVDSPVVGYGSWGQGTQKYADMFYEATLGDLLNVHDDSIVGDPNRGTYFTAHSQVIQAWMEGGILAGAFFLTYMVMLVRALWRLLFVRVADYLTPLLAFTLGANLWASVMSPFLGNQRIAMSLTMAGIVLLLLEARAPARDHALRPASRELQRPANLMT